MKKKPGIFAMLLCFGAAFSQETYSQWSKYKVITVNTTASGGGANIAASVANFPTLVRLTSANSDVFTQTATGGLDIRFSTADGTTPLKFQRERWDGTAQLAEFWVLLPSVAGNASTTFRMYWGKSGAADSSNSVAVFDTSNGFMGNWHMGKGAPGSTTVLDTDATVNANHLRWMNGVTSTGKGAVVEGLIGKADSLYNPQVASTTGAANATFLTKSATGNASFVTNTNALTMSAWIKRTGPGGGTVAQSAVQDEGIIGRFRFSGSGLNLFDLEYTPTPGGTSGTTVGTGTTCTGGIGTKTQHSIGYTFHYFTNTTSGTERYGCSDVTSVGGWDYVVGIMTATQQIFYVNGVMVNTQSDAIGGNILAGTTATTNWGNTALVIGKIDSADNTYNQSFNGIIDEVGFSKTVRDSNWVKLSYATQKPSVTALTLGSSIANVTATAPGAPTAVAGTAGNGQVSVTWTAPSDGGSPITGYTVSSTPSSAGCTTSSGTTCTVTGLTNNTGYTFTVTATNSVGTSAASAPSGTLTPTAPAQAPSAPTGMTATAGNGRATLVWIASTSNGSAITGYIVTSNPDSKTCSTTGALTCVDSTLTNGTAYTFTVVVTSAAGNSSASAPSNSVMPLGVPGPPVGATGAAGNALVVVSWQAPASNGGSAVTSYTVTTVQDTTRKCTATGTTTCTVNGLTNGLSYSFTVTATNAQGTGSASVASGVVTPVTVPGAPLTVTGLGASGQVTVSWQAPASTGGSAITAYTVTTVQDTTKKCTTTGLLTCVVTGLTNTTAYTFTVTATNSAGKGAVSAPSGSVTAIAAFSARYGFTYRMSGPTVLFRIPDEMAGRLAILDLWGREVWSSPVGEKHELSWDRKSASPGVYIVRVTKTAGRKSEVAAESKMLLTP